MNELYQQSLCLSDQKAKAQGQNVIQSEKQFWSMSIRSVDMGLHFVSDECSSCSTSENVILSFLWHHLKNRPISIKILKTLCSAREKETSHHKTERLRKLAALSRILVYETYPPVDMTGHCAVVKVVL